MSENYLHPSILTYPPGPLSKEYLDAQELVESNARTYPRRLPFAIRRAQGSYIEDVDGNVYLDFLSGAGVLCLGHNHPDLVAAAKEQFGTLVHGLDLPTPVKDEFIRRQRPGCSPCPVARSPGSPTWSAWLGDQRPAGQ